MSRVLNEIESYKLFEKYGIRILPYRLCTHLEEALLEAEKLGYPVVAKVVSDDIFHKTDAGCICTGIENSDQLKGAWESILDNAKKYKPDARIRGILVQKMGTGGLELIFGIKNDDQFGHVILFGIGGIYAEVIGDVALRLLPVEESDAEEMIKEIKMYDILSGARGKKYDIKAIKSIIISISNMVKDNPDITEMDINPVFVYEGEGGAFAADGLVIRGKLR